MQFSRTKTKRNLGTPSEVEADADSGKHNIRRCEITYVDRFAAKIGENGFLSIAIADAIKLRYRLDRLPPSLDFRELVINDGYMTITFIDTYVIIIPESELDDAGIVRSVNFTTTTHRSLCERWNTASVEDLPGTAIFYEDIDPGIVSGEIQLSVGKSSDFRSDDSTPEHISDAKEIRFLLQNMKSIL